MPPECRGTLKAHVHPKDIAWCIEFCTDGKSENHPTKMLELFQNINRSARCLLGEHGPLKFVLHQHLNSESCGRGYRCDVF